MRTLAPTFLMTLLFIMVTTLSCAGDTNTNWLTDVKPDDGAYKACALTDKKPFAQYTATKIDYTLNPQNYGLPVDPSQIENLDQDIRNNPEFDFTDAAQARLLQYGFVLVPASRSISRFDEAYTALKDTQKPTLVTVDSSLHLGHLFFEQVLKYVEVRQLIPILNALLPDLAETLLSIYKAQKGELREAALRDLAFISVALKLLGSTDFEVPFILTNQVDQEVARIESAGEALDQGQDTSVIFNHDCSRDIACGGTDIDDQAYEKGRACLCEDYRQYKPRGHYTETKALERYFRSATYLSRMRMRLKSPVETRMAALLTAALNKTTVNIDGKNVKAPFFWDRIYRTVSFFVGAADDLTFIEYDKLLRATYGDSFAMSDLSDDDKLEIFRTGLKQERVREATSGYARSSVDSLDSVSGLSFLNHAFPFDAYALSRLVYEQIGPNPNRTEYSYILDNLNAECRENAGEEDITGAFQQCDGQSAADYRYICCSAIELSKSENRPELADTCRLLPSGLDVASVFGSTRAQGHLAQDANGYCGYENASGSLQQEVTAFTDADFYKTLYSTWSLALQPLFDKDLTGFPVWMTTDLYQDKSLNTALSSWAQLRHDTIHYIKQTWEPGFVTISPPSDLYWVEPLPEVYAALSDLAKLVSTGLQDMELSDDDLSEPVNGFIDLIDSLTTMAIDELEGKELTALEKSSIEHIGDDMKSIIDKLALVTGEKQDKPSDDPMLVEKLEIQGEPYKTTVISDIYHDSYLDNALYAGSGTIDWLIALRPINGDQLGAVIGPVFSYYEFSRPTQDQLDDEQWIELLNSNSAPARPAFIRDLFPTNN
jgi:hypothetical protein